ncbi:MAG: symmetrical bis(5'-nucleosyl)-tetraphosphatase [Gammaproteobacteria bacterium]|nr:symmetrical bis(5'-nucleosyl)-tetraphosphatase [Gammaproteobacteria bacterium]
MPTYAIGDIQGCHDPLLALLEAIRFDTAGDRLWFTGDLVNRGPHSLEVLRLVRDLGDAAVTVLGNHDLHLLAVAARPEHKPKKKDTLDAILQAPDRDELLDWLRHRPLIHRGHGYTLVHAGLVPQWNVADAERLAAELHEVLRGTGHGEFLAHMYGDGPSRWNEDLTGWDRLRCITNVFTRLRYCDTHGRMDLAEKRPPTDVPPPLMPWYAVPGRASAGEPIIFGHWSTLALAPLPDPALRVHPLDMGCLWGGRLTALRLEDGRRFDFHCPRFSRPDLKA